MINHRVQNTEGLVKKLQANSVTIFDKIETYQYGKFVHIMDAEGNKIKLWEPAEAVKAATEEKNAKENRRKNRPSLCCCSAGCSQCRRRSSSCQ